MKLPASAKTSTTFSRPLIQKGYYPGKLVGVKPYANQDGQLIERKYGHQLIFEFEVFNNDDKGKPTTHVKFKGEDGTEKDVKLSKFVYHMYKNDAKDGQPAEFRTAVTPKSAITKLLECLGWAFTADGVDPDEYIGKWVELNVDDYTKDDGTKMSTIEKINAYEGPEVETPLPSTPVMCNSPVATDTSDIAKVSKCVEDGPKEEKSDVIIALEKKIETMTTFHKDGIISDQALEDALEQIQCDIDKEESE